MGSSGREVRSQRTGEIGADQAREVPYEEIDCEIRRLVRLINQFSGVRTVASCAGHEGTIETEIDFVAQSQQHVAKLLRSMPFWGWRGGFHNNQVEQCVIWAAVSPDENCGLVYKLRLGGYPPYVQRALIGGVETALLDALSRLRDRRPPSARRASADKADRQRHCQ